MLGVIVAAFFVEFLTPDEDTDSRLKDLITFLARFGINSTAVWLTTI